MFAGCNAMDWRTKSYYSKSPHMGLHQLWWIRHVRRWKWAYLSWEKATLRNAKKALDDAYIKSLPPRVRANVLERRVHHTPSKRGPPPDALQWAVRILTPETPPATPAVTRRLETPAARAAPTRTDNPLRTPCTSQSPVTPRATATATTMEDKNPWDSYGKPCFQILNLTCSVICTSLTTWIPRMSLPSPL